jgi:hypothetical protein
MKKYSLLIAAFLAALAGSALAISPKRIESAKKRAAEQGKLIAFVVERDYWDPNCPKCIAAVDNSNGAIDKAVPSGVVVIRIAESELEKGVIPDCVMAAGGVPRIVVTDATCAKVIDAVDEKADRARIKQLNEKVAAATAK